MKRGHQPVSPLTTAHIHTEKGITIREHIAGQVLAGLISKSSPTLHIQTLAKNAVQLTDALLLELDK